MESVSLLVNAGGESRRMGQAKALLPIPESGEPLLRHIIRHLAPLVSAGVIVVANDERLLAALDADKEIRWVSDDYPQGGPLGGIASGLRRCAGWAITIACDLPLINPAVVQYLIGVALSSTQETGVQWQAVVPLVEETPQPLHALYHRLALPALEKRLAAGERRAASFLADVPVRWVTETELRPFDPELRSFTNVNTPDEWAAACRLLGV